MQLGDWHLWLERRADHISHGGDICLPGGRIDQGETGSQAALREWEEETGIPASRLELLGIFGTHVHPSGQTIEVWMALGPELSGLQTRPSEEVAELLCPSLMDLLSADWAREDLSLVLRPGPRPHPSGPEGHKVKSFPVFHADGYDTSLWGMTASILLDFFRLLFEVGALPAMPNIGCLDQDP